MRAQAAREAQMRAQAERESQMRAQAERESRMRAQAEQESRERAAQAAAATARSNAQARWIDQIRSRIRGNINLPPDIPGNPEAIFDVVQLPTGEIIEVKLRKSSGVRAYDDAVQRGILKSSPLPKPVPADLFQRSLELHFRPLDQ
ncbi:MAG TPA: cell envelope integrity protein TolA [Casimicrobiaceae bacterium]|nr:cell envelope integrity protein TolA [Casimicrobiaceae bacterium]